MQQEEIEDDLMIPLNVNARIAPFIDRYFVKQYVDNQYIFQHSNKLYLIGISHNHPIMLQPIKDIVFASEEHDLQVKGKKKRGGIRVKKDSLLATVTLVDSSQHRILAMVEGFIIEINENLRKNQEYLRSFPEEKGFVAIIQSGKKH